MFSPNQVNIEFKEASNTSFICIKQFFMKIFFPYKHNKLHQTNIQSKDIKAFNAKLVCIT